MKFLEHAAVFEPHTWPEDGELDGHGEDAISFFINEVQTEEKEPCDAVPYPVRDPLFCAFCLIF